MATITFDDALVDPIADPRWRRLESPGGSLFTSTAWLAVLRDGYGLSFRSALIGEADEPRGGIAWAEIDDVRGHRLTSLPFTDYADPAGSVSADEWAAVVSTLVETGLPLTARLLTAERPDVPGIRESGRLAWHSAEIDGTESELWANLKSGARQNIRKAQRNDVRVRVGSSASDVAAFRSLHVSLRKTKYRMLAQPTRFFDALVSHFGPDNLRVILADIDGEVVAGILLLRHGLTAYYKFNASTERGLADRANDLVMWTALLEAQRWGCDRFDFGVSDLDQPGLIRYKRKYASDEAEVSILKHDGIPVRPIGRLAGHVFPLLTRAFTDDRCPDRVTSAAGDRLYRFFC